MHKDFYTTIPDWMYANPPVVETLSCITGRVTRICVAPEAIYCYVNQIPLMLIKDNVSKFFAQQAILNSKVCVYVAKTHELNNRGRRKTGNRLLEFRLYTKKITATNVRYSDLFIKQPPVQSIEWYKVYLSEGDNSCKWPTLLSL